MCCGSSATPASSATFFAWSRHHGDGQDRQDDPAGNRNGTAADVEEPHQQRSECEQDERGNDRRHNHPPADGALRLRVEMLGFFEERHEGDLGSHADKQEQKELRHQFKIDDREIH